jgi:opacity protein-like surface antigen
MDQLSRFLITIGLISAPTLRGVYAPVPENEQGKDFVLSVKGGLAHDSNLFGAATNAISSAILTLAPRATYNRSLTDQTFLSASYGLTLDQFDNRPGDKLLDSHDLNLRLAHAFSKKTTIDVNESLSIARNPESLLAGIRLNMDQSYTRNQIDGRFETPLAAKLGLTAKLRSVYYEYREAVLGRSLDRIENLYGLSADYAVLPETKAVVEYRHQDIYYTKMGEAKNKTSEYLMGGVDYEVARKLTLNGRLGIEWRSRRSERDAMAPYLELSAKHDYAEKSFILGGLGYSIDETSNTATYNDAKIYRLFVSLRHSLTALIVASGSVSFEPSTLQGRRGQADVDETSVRMGAALSYLPTRNWIVSASFDYDRVRSDEATRALRRTRFGLNATHSF